MRTLVAIILLAAVSAFGQFSGGPPTVSNVRVVQTSAQFTNTVIALNAASIDGVKRTIQLAPGTFYVLHNMRVSNNICIKGAGMDQTKIVVARKQADSSVPPIALYDNCEVSDLTIHQTNVTGTAYCLGYHAVGVDDPSSTNVTVNRVRFIGDTDCLWLVNDGVATVGGREGHIDWAINDSEFESRFDTVYLEGGSTTIQLDPLIRAVFRGCRFNAHGPSLVTTAAERGDVTNVRLIAQPSRAEFYGCYFHSSGGTNTTTMAFLSGPSFTDPANFLYGGGLYLNSCQVEIIGTNLSTGGVGAGMVQSTNGWVFLNSVLANSNNIIGTGTNFWQHSGGLNIAFTSSLLTPVSQLTNFTADFNFAERHYLLTNNFHVSALANVASEVGPRYWLAKLENLSGSTKTVSVSPSMKRSGTNFVAVPNGSAATVLLRSFGPQLSNTLATITLLDSP